MIKSILLIEKNVSQYMFKYQFSQQTNYQQNKKKSN